MNSAQIISECAVEKRRQNPDYQPSLVELKAVDAVLVAQAREAGGFDFGTSPHGLSADLRSSWQETRERPPACPPAKPLLPFGETQSHMVELPLPVSGTSAVVLLPVDAAATPRAQQPASLPVDAVSTARSEAMSEARTERNGEPDSPGVYRSPAVRSACCCLRKAVAEHYYPLVVSTSQMALMHRAFSLAIDDVIEAMSDEPYGRDEIQPDIDGFNRLHRLLNAARSARCGEANEGWRGNML